MHRSNITQLSWLFRFLICGFIVFSSAAKVITVDNSSARWADFTSAREAHDAADAGDTLQFAGSPKSYGSLTLSKRLTIIGPGSRLDWNYPELPNFLAANFEQVEFAEGSAGSAMISCTLESAVIRTDLITLQRNFMESVSIRTLTTDLSTQGHVIFQNRIEGTGIVIAASSSGSHTNIRISNNLILYQGSTTYYSVRGIGYTIGTKKRANEPAISSNFI